MTREELVEQIAAEAAAIPSDSDAWRFRAGIGLDPDMSLSRLRADLQIAARVRECEADWGRMVVNAPGKRWIDASPDLLAWLLEGSDG